MISPIEKLGETITTKLINFFGSKAATMNGKFKPFIEVNHLNTKKIDLSIEDYVNPKETHFDIKISS